MSFRFQKRIKLGKGFGINLSKSGMSPSYRTKKGSISSKGYSIKTGMPGLTYRKNFSKVSKGGCAGILLLFTLSSYTIINTIKSVIMGYRRGYY